MSPGILNRAVQLLSNGDFFLAERTANRGILTEPENGKLYEVRGIARHRLGYIWPTIHDLETAMSLIPISPQAQWCLADVYFTAGLKVSATDLLRALVRREDCPNALLLRTGESLRHAEEDKLALWAFFTLSQRQPNSAEAHYAVAISKSHLDHPIREILPHLRRAVELVPRNRNYQAALAMLYFEDGNHREAANLLLRIRPTQVLCRHVATNIARTLESLGHQPRAAKWWKRGMRLARVRSLEVQASGPA